LAIDQGAKAPTFEVRKLRAVPFVLMRAHGLEQLSEKIDSFRPGSRFTFRQSLGCRYLFVGCDLEFKAGTITDAEELARSVSEHFRGSVSVVYGLGDMAIGEIPYHVIWSEAVESAADIVLKVPMGRIEPLKATGDAV
jgi:hypothetical protein